MNAMLHQETPYRAWLRIEDLLLLEEAGVFADVAKTELIDGEIICMNSQFRRHSYCKSQLAYRLHEALQRLDNGLAAITEASVGMPPHDLPEPDIVVTSEPLGEGFVPLASVRLLIEVADSTAAFDLGRKAALYSRHAVPEYWIVDINAQRIVRLWMPEIAGYAQSATTGIGQPITAATIPGLTVATDKLG